MNQDALISEIAEWSRKLKNLDSQRRSHQDEQEKILNSQRQQIEALKQENAKLQDGLLQDSQVAGPPPSSAQQGRIDKLHELADTYRRKVEVESRQVEALQKELEVTQAKVEGTMLPVLDMRRLAGGSQAASEAVKQVAKTKTLLQNRLEQAEKKFGEALTRNNELRAAIEEQNKSREAFEQVCSQLERQLAAASAEVDSLKGAVTVANEARALAVTQAATLTTQNDKEQAAFEEQLQGLTAAEAADKALLQTQAARLAGVVEAVMARESAATLEEPGGITYEQAVTQLVHAMFQLTTPPPSGEAPTVSQLPDVSKPEGLSQLVWHFVRVESLNFEIFTACNLANERIGTMQKELKTLRAEIAQAEGEGAAGKQKEVIRATLAKREQVIKHAETLKEQTLVLERRLALVRAGVTAALRALSVAPMAPERPEDKASVYATLMTNLGQLEARSRSVAAVHASIMGRDGGGGAAARSMTPPQLLPGRSQPHTPERPGSASLRGPTKARPGSGTPTMQQPTPGGGGDSGSDDDSDSDDGSVPLTREQLQAKLGYNMPFK